MEIFSFLPATGAVQLHKKGLSMNREAFNFKLLVVFVFIFRFFFFLFWRLGRRLGHLPLLRSDLALWSCARVGSGNWTAVRTWHRPICVVGSRLLSLSRRRCLALWRGIPIRIVGRSLLPLLLL